MRRAWADGLRRGSGRGDYEPAKLEAAWMFTRKDGGVLHLAFALAIGQFGEVYAGGVGENGYPAVAYIGG